MVLEGLGGGKRHGRATCHGVPGLLFKSLVRFCDGRLVGQLQYMLDDVHWH